MRRSVFFTLSQAERRGRLHCSDWPNLDWENEWVMLTTYKDFDRSIDMDAVSGKLQEVFDIPYGGPYDVENGEDVKTGVSEKTTDKEIIKDWSVQWRLK